MILVKGCNPGQQHQQCLLNQRVSAIGVFEDIFAELVKVSGHELSTGAAGCELELHPLPPRIALDKPREPADGGSTRWKEGT